MRKGSKIEVFVARALPARGGALCERGFLQSEAAVAFLANLHGLDPEETRWLQREGSLKLDHRRHGAARCEVRSTKMAPNDAVQALSGDLYLPETPPLITVSARPVAPKIRLRRRRVPRRKG